MQNNLAIEVNFFRYLVRNYLTSKI